MFGIERKFWTWAEKNLHMILVLLVSAAGLLIRLSLRQFFSDDAGWYLLPWYDEIVESGQLGALDRQVGNYNILYQFLIALMTYLPIPALFCYKILSCIFDYLLAGAAAYLAGQITEKGRKWKCLAAYAVVLFSPVVTANSALWAQCDSIYTFWIIMAMIALVKGRYVRTFVFYGIALSFKLQAVFFLPFLLFVYFYSKKFTALYFGIIPAAMCLSALPGLVMGRNPGDIFTVYMEQTQEYPRLSSGYPTPWLFISNSGAAEIYQLYKGYAVGLALCALAAWMTFWLIRRVALTPSNMVYMAFILVYTAVLLLPAMHERYGYVYEILAAVILFRNRKTIPLFAALLGISMCSYGSFLHYRAADYDLLAVVNCMVYLAYGFLLTGQMAGGRRDGLEGQSEECAADWDKGLEK